MATAEQPQVAQRVTLNIDSAHSLVEFSVKHMMFTTVKGRFGTVRGTILIDEAELANSQVDVEIEASSIDTREPQRDGHLRSADFLDADQYPLITFRSTRVEVKGEDRADVIGDLTIHGETRTVTLDTTFNGRGVNPYNLHVAGFSATTTISRKEFGLTWNVALEAGGFLVGDEIKIAIEVQAVQAN